jgi:hypothetical protein
LAQMERATRYSSLPGKKKEKQGFRFLQAKSLLLQSRGSRVIGSDFLIRAGKRGDFPEIAMAHLINVNSSG